MAKGGGAREIVVTDGQVCAEITIRVPQLPDPAAPVEEFDDAIRKRVIAAMMQPGSMRALEEGLQAADLRERRLWWTLGVQHVMPLLQGKNGDGGAGSVKIVFDQRVPGPAQAEDGPLPGRRPGASIDVT